MVAPRGTRLRRRVALILAAVVGAAIIYAGWLEPRWLRLNHQRITLAKLDAPVRIVLVADLHSDAPSAFGTRVATLVNEQRADVILVAGDLVTPAARTEGAEAFLNRLHAPLGVFVVPGNHEHWALSGPPKKFFRSKKATLLVNETQALREDLWLVGLDDALAGRPAPQILDAVPSEVARIAMLHSPAGVSAVAGRAELAVAGHSHGGQVRLPLFGALALPPGVGGYDAGWYTVDGTELFVTVGVGTSVVPIRFGCRPEIVVIDASPPPDA